MSKQEPATGLTLEQARNLDEQVRQLHSAWWEGLTREDDLLWRLTCLYLSPMATATELESQEQSTRRPDEDRRTALFAAKMRLGKDLTADDLIKITSGSGCFLEEGIRAAIRIDLKRMSR